MDEQGTAEWRMARAGRVTASRMADLLAATKTGYGASRAHYMDDLLIERLTGKPIEGFTSRDMQWGTDTEPQARSAYSFQSGNDVQLCGFIQHPTIEQSGASPDGLIGSDGLVEIKCPASHTHLETLLGGSIPKRYCDQIQWQLAVTGRAWCDFVSFDPRLPPHLQLFVRRMERDAARIEHITGEVRQFLAELDAKLTALAERYAEAA